MGRWYIGRSHSNRKRVIPKRVVFGGTPLWEKCKCGLYRSTKPPFDHVNVKEQALADFLNEIEKCQKQESYDET